MNGMDKITSEIEWHYDDLNSTVMYIHHELCAKYMKVHDKDSEMAEYLKHFAELLENEFGLNGYIG